MIDPSMLDQLARKLAEAVPPGIKDLQHDLEKNFRAVLQSTLTKLNLVTREEFDVQAGVLARTREKVEQLEQALTRLEAQAGIAPPERPAPDTNHYQGD